MGSISVRDGTGRHTHKFRATKIVGQRCNSVAVLKNQTKCGTEMRQNAQNRLQITKPSLAAGVPPQTLINRGAYNVFQDCMAFPADADCSRTRESFLHLCSVCWGGRLPDILSVYLLAACTLSPQSFPAVDATGWGWRCDGFGSSKTSWELSNNDKWKLIICGYVSSTATTTT